MSMNMALRLACASAVAMVSAIAVTGSIAAEIVGQAFVVTASRDNVKLGLMTIRAIPEAPVRIYLDALGGEMQSETETLANSCAEIGKRAAKVDLAGAWGEGLVERELRGRGPLDDGESAKLSV